MFTAVYLFNINWVLKKKSRIRLQDGATLSLYYKKRFFRT